MRKIISPFALCLICLLPSSLMPAQRRPDPRADARSRERGTVPVEKPNRWDHGQRAKEFNRVAEGRTTEKGRTEERRDTERDPRRGGPKRVEKSQRWERSRRKGEFNSVAERSVEDKRTNRETRIDGGRGYVEKAERRRTRNSIKEDFNKVANPPPDGGGGGRDGRNNGGRDDAAAPPAAPAPRPPQP
jgi:hypothetical protein